MIISTAARDGRGGGDDGGAGARALAATSAVATALRQPVPGGACAASVAAEAARAAVAMHRAECLVRVKEIDSASTVEVKRLTETGATERCRIEEEHRSGRYDRGSRVAELSVAESAKTTRLSAEVQGKIASEAVAASARVEEAKCESAVKIAGIAASGPWARAAHVLFGVLLGELLSRRGRRRGLRLPGQGGAGSALSRRLLLSALVIVLPAYLLRRFVIATSSIAAIVGIDLYGFGLRVAGGQQAQGLAAWLLDRQRVRLAQRLPSWLASLWIPNSAALKAAPGVPAARAPLARGPEEKAPPGREGALAGLDADAGGGACGAGGADAAGGWARGADLADASCAGDPLDTSGAGGPPNAPAAGEAAGSAADAGDEAAGAGGFAAREVGSIAEALAPWGLEIYAEALGRCGYDRQTLSMISGAGEREEMLGAIGCKPGHRVRFQRLLDGQSPPAAASSPPAAAGSP